MSTIGSVQSLSDVQTISGVAPSAISPTPTTDGQGVSVSISKRAQLLSSLDSLATSDPAKFKTVTGNIADQLRQAASKQSGGAADFLNKLADRFSSASSSGDASALQPPSGQGHHGGGHHHVHRAAGGVQPGQGGTAGTGTGAGASGPGDNLGQTIEDIISNALADTSTGS